MRGESSQEVREEKVSPQIKRGILTEVQWTTVPCKLKILKLFIKELGNIAEGEESGEVGEGDGTVGVGVGGGGNEENGWEDSDDDDDLGSSDDDEWEDVGSGSNEPDDTTSQQDMLKGINTKVLPRHEMELMLDFYY